MGALIVVDVVGQKGDHTIDPLFDDTEVAAFAKKLPNHIQTIGEIQEHYGVSYRQARKIKSALDDLENAPNIHRINTG